MNLYERVLAEVTPYLGKRAEAVLQSQCKAHLKITPGELTSEHLGQLAKWVQISAALLISKEDAETMGRKILMLKNE